MSSLEKHLNELKNFKSVIPTDDGNQIYFLEVKEKPGLVKIGDTLRDVETRNNETLTNASLHRVRPPFVAASKKYDGSSFRDKDFHKFLIKKGYKPELNDNGRDSEWFPMSLEQEILPEFKNFIGKPVYETVKLTNSQCYLLEKYILLKENNTHQYIKGDICMRAGKTILSLYIAKLNDSVPVYIGKNLTSQSSAESDNERYGIVPKIVTQSLHGVDELVDGDLSKRTKKIINNIDKVNIENKPLQFFVDEVDDSSWTPKSRAMIKSIVEHYRNKGKLAGIMTMSGTRSWRGEKILKELTNDTISELSLLYWEKQILDPDITCNRNFRSINFYSDSAEEFTNISDAMKNKDTGQRSIASCFVKLLGTNNFDIDINPDFPHYFIKFCINDKDRLNSFTRYMNRNHSTIENKKYYYAAITGDETTSKEAEEYCNQLIRNNPGKTCVFLTQGMATTSFSVVTIGTTIVFTDNPLTADDIQALHRGVTWGPGKEHGNMVLVTTNRSSEYSFEDPFRDEMGVANTRDDKIMLYKELLNNNSIIHFHEKDGFCPVNVTTENAALVIDKKMREMTTISSLMVTLTEMDEDLQDYIINNTIIGKTGSGKKSKTVKPLTFNPFGTNVNGISINKNIVSENCSVSITEKQKAFRAFAENVVNIPAIAREQETTIEKFEYWKQVKISKKVFFNLYNSSQTFKDKIDTIYNLCTDKKYLVDNYINNIVL